jgi:hypothetical protein
VDVRHPEETEVASGPVSKATEDKETEVASGPASKATEDKETEVASGKYSKNEKLESICQFSIYANGLFCMYLIGLSFQFLKLKYTV